MDCVYLGDETYNSLDKAVLSFLSSGYFQLCILR